MSFSCRATTTMHSKLPPSIALSGISSLTAEQKPSNSNLNSSLSIEDKYRNAETPVRHILLVPGILVHLHHVMLALRLKSQPQNSIPQPVAVPRTFPRCNLSWLRLRRCPTRFSHLRPQRISSESECNNRPVAVCFIVQLEVD